MGNLLRMDLYRMRKAKSFWVCLILAFLFGLLSTPGVKLMTVVAGLVSNEKNLFPATADLSGIIKAPFPILNAMLALLSVNSFFYADVENGYIKNIAGQMPKRGYTIFSKFLAVIPHNRVSKDHRGWCGPRSLRDPSAEAAADTEPLYDPAAGDSDLPEQIFWNGTCGSLRPWPSVSGLYGNRRRSRPAVAEEKLFHCELYAGSASEQRFTGCGEIFGGLCRHDRHFSVSIDPYF